MLQSNTAPFARLARHGGVASLILALAISPALGKQAHTSTCSPNLNMQNGDRGSAILADGDLGDVGPDSIRPPNRMADVDPDDVGPDSIRPPNRMADLDPGDVGPDSIRPPNRMADSDPGDIGPNSIRPPNKLA